MNSCVATSEEKGAALIRKTCNHTMYEKICISMFESDPRSFKANYTGLLRIGIELSVSLTNDTLSYISKVFDNTSEASNHTLWLKMKDCHDNYDFAVFEISQALDLFDKGFYGDASRKVSYASDAAFLCRTNGVPQFTERNKKVDKFTSDIMLLLYPNPPK
nr:cell wall / vacuolar inhibitor of fructosidase 2 [Quercus suber]